jgi:mannose-6-phosphate isomerase
MLKLYPLLFKPIFKEKIWGGDKISRILGKSFAPLANCGETWELSGVKDNISEVANGPLKGDLLSELLKEYGERILGKQAYKKFGAEFPLLVKFLDAKEDLSIQVHPNDALAMERHQCLGKTEMWYVIQADEGASLISGFNRALNKEKYKAYFDTGRLNEILNHEAVLDGDVFFIPSGRVHTIGKGLLIAEIQQTSDITYRIYDFDRTDEQGNKRELHVEQALDAIDYTHYPQYKSPYNKSLIGSQTPVSCPYFETRFHRLKQNSIPIENPDQSFRILTVVGGKGNLKYGKNALSIQLGDVILVPAELGAFSISTDESLVVLETKAF